MKKCLWCIAALLVLTAIVAAGLSWGLKAAGKPPAESAPMGESTPLTVVEHGPVVEPRTVDDPVVGFCGNTFTTIIMDGHVYSITDGDSVELTALLVNAAYDPQALCDCIAPVRVITEMDTDTYGLNPDGAYIRCFKGQAALTAEQVELVQGILSRLGEEDRIQ